MAVYVKPLTMITAAGHQSAARDILAILNLDDPAGIALTVDAASASVLPAGALYWAHNGEAETVFLRVGSATNQLASAVHLPLGPGREVQFYVGAGVTHIHAGSGA